jgi:MoCo/4Fe-4S cofactor protein with predicted Tat translocation signal
MVDQPSKEYWKSLEESLGRGDSESPGQDEFQFPDNPLHQDASRRSFLKLAGFSFTGAMASGCVPAAAKKLIPHLVAPENIVPGKSYWYASVCGSCPAACGILTKCRDGRPIKLEGNKLHAVSKGGLCAVGQASVLGLYDSLRLTGPTKKGKESSWSSVDDEIKAKLGLINTAGQGVRFLSGSVVSPTLQGQINEFVNSFPDGQHVSYDPLSVSAILDAHEKSFGHRLLPHYKFHKAKVILSFATDFLGTWISPSEFTRAYRQGRSLRKEGGEPRLSRHIQVESRLSLTGSNADERAIVDPQDIPVIIAHLAVAIASKTKWKLELGPLPKCPLDKALMEKWAEELWHARGHSLVVCGVNDVEVQVLINVMNHCLGNYGETLDISKPSYQKQGDDKAVESLLAEMKAGEVKALFLYGVNPVYDWPLGTEFAKALEKVALVVSFAERVDESSRLAHYICPDHHFLESWTDAEPVAGIVSLGQPAIEAMGKTRSVLESLSRWLGKEKTALEVVQGHWRAKLFTRQKRASQFQKFWEKSLQDGCATVAVNKRPLKAFNKGAISWTKPSKAAAGYALVLYPKVSILAGSQAHNAWLQELPDPVTKTVWDNYACLSPKSADKLSIKTGDIVRIKTGKGEDKQLLELPALVQVGQAESVIAVALGYGRLGTDRFEEVGPQWIESRPTVERGQAVGVNSAPLLELRDRLIRYWRDSVTIEKTGEFKALASTQTYHSLQLPEHIAGEGNKRAIIAETTLEQYKKDPAAGIHKGHPIHSLWNEDHKYKGHHWGLVVDLNACTGCSSCVISCQAENNIPVVGRDEVARGRDMHWMRLDRYYSQEPDSEDVDVIHQPMMCQHCDNAPCEVVCPVLATVHSSEGINQQVYNRCVGTRYCANNCPYKTRRFNWFDYPHQDKTQHMVLNPDVTVRSRGVMEKCSFCFQRIQEAKARSGDQLVDGDIQTACQQSCPAQAISFGDMNDAASSVSKQIASPRHFRVLEELNIKPSVGYLTKLRNREQKAGGERHG